MAPAPTPRRMIPKPYVDATTSGKSQLLWQVFFEGKWEKVDTVDAEELEKGYSKGFDNFQVSLRNQWCTISLDPFPWTFTDSAGVTRSIRRWINRPRSGIASIPDEVETWPVGAYHNISRTSFKKSHNSLLEDEIVDIVDNIKEDQLGQRCVADDIDRIFIWRSNDWHPISQNQTSQIIMNLTDGAKVFDVKDGPYDWVIDTTKPDGWIQISKNTGRKWPLKCQFDAAAADPTPRIPHQGRTNLSRHGKLSPRAISLEGDASPVEFSNERFPSVKLTESLRHEWNAVRRQISASRNGQAVHCLDQRELIKVWMDANGRTGTEFQDLIQQTVADMFLKIDLSRNGSIEEPEWMHYWLLENQAPSFHALSQINQKLLVWLQNDSKVLEKLNNIFAQNACGEDDAQLTAMQMKIAATSWLSELQRSFLSNSKVTKAQLDVVEYLEELTSSETILDEDELLSYYDFVNHMLGRRKEKVQLYQYDLSQGSAKVFSSMLVGKQLDGIWHTSVVAFDKEYWLGGKVFESEPGTTPFGTPDKIIDLPERTMRTKADFLHFLERHLSHKFTPETYDVLTHNCNHFTDAAIMFLLNMHIPQEILSQTELISIDTWSMKLLRPMLNCALARFEASSSTRDLHLLATERSVSKNDWASITVGSLVVWEHDKGWTRIARVISLSPEDQTCVLRWLDTRSGQLHIEIGVRRCEVQTLRHLDTLVQEYRLPCDSMIGGTFGARFQKFIVAC